jgi:hypothetical protein
MHNVMIALYHLSLQLLSDHCHTNSSPFDYVLPTSFPGRLLARVLKEGVQFWYNDTSTVRGGGGFEKTFLWKTFDVYVTSCQYLFQARSKVFKHTWLCEFVPLCCFLNYDIFIQPSTPSNWSKCQMCNKNENWSYFVSDILIFLGK